MSRSSGARCCSPTWPGAPVSSGFIHSCLRKAAALAADVVRLIRTLITAARVAGFDETTLRAGPAGQKKYVLGAFTEQHSLFFLGARTLESFRDFGILPGFAGVVVSGPVRQLLPCWLGVRRRASGVSFPPAQGLSGRCRELPRRDLAGAGAAGAARTDPRLARRPRCRPWAAIPAGTAGPLILEFRRAVRAGLASVPRIPGPKASTAQHPGRDLLEFVEHGREDAVLRFTRDTTIWPTNNLSERGVRPLKTQQKISGRLTSEDATQDRLDIRSYIDTARKHGQDTLTVLRGLFTGTPWRPPAPAALSP